MTFEPTIRSQSDLHDAWATLMQPLGFSGHSIWLMMIDRDDRPVPHLTEIEEAVHAPVDVELAGFAEMVRLLHEKIVPDGRFAFLRARPGPAGITEADRAWACALYEAGRMAGVPVDVVHRACDVDLVPIPMDEVLVQSA